MPVLKFITLRALLLPREMQKNISLKIASAVQDKA